MSEHAPLPAPTLPEMTVVDTGLGRIACRIAGPEDAPVVVCLHGLGGGAKSWSRQLAHLPPDYRVIAWDCPGYGGSDPHPKARPVADDYAAVLLRLLDRLGVERFDLVGHSMGGIVAPRVVAQAPHRVRRLVLSATKTGFRGPDAAGFASRLKDFETLSAEAFGKARADGMVGAEADPAIHAEVAAIAAEIRAEGYAGAVHLLTTSDNTAILRALQQPTIVIAGARDRIAEDARTAELAATVPGAVRHVVADAAHAAYLEQWQAYNALLRDFLGQEGS